MKIVSLNIWGARLRDRLITFVKKYSSSVDFFCFQEVFSVDSTAGDIRNPDFDIFRLLAKNLPDHYGLFSPSYPLGRSLTETTGVSAGLAMFVKKSIPLKSCGDVFIFGRKTKIPVNDLKTAPRNLQYALFEYHKQEYLLCHFHGLWYPKDKRDSPDRLTQSENIRRFMDAYPQNTLLGGDYNLLPGTKSLRLLEEDMVNLISLYRIITTRNLYYHRREAHADYMLVSPNVKVKSFRVIKENVSDHLPLELVI